MSDKYNTASTPSALPKCCSPGSNCPSLPSNPNILEPNVINKLVELLTDLVKQSLGSAGQSPVICSNSGTSSMQSSSKDATEPEPSTTPSPSQDCEASSHGPSPNTPDLSLSPKHSHIDLINNLDEFASDLK